MPVREIGIVLVWISGVIISLAALVVAISTILKPVRRLGAWIRSEVLDWVEEVFMPELCKITNQQERTRITVDRLDSRMGRVETRVGEVERIVSNGLSHKVDYIDKQVRETILPALEQLNDQTKKEEGNESV